MTCSGKFRTAREHLAEHNLAIANSRGKFSNAAKTHLQEDLDNGCTFTDYPKVGAQTSRPIVLGKQTTTAPVRSVGIAVEPTKVWDEEATIFESEDGVQTGWKEVCANCHKSLIYCFDPVCFAIVPYKGGLGPRQARVLRFTKVGHKQLFSPLDRPTEKC